MVKAAMSEISTIGGVKVRVSSHDYADVEAARDEVLALIEGGAELEIIKDLSLGKTDCIIETPFGSVDCSLDTQLSVLKHNVYLILNGE
jgi:flagellar assembly protein FliH